MKAIQFPLLALATAFVLALGFSPVHAADSGNPFTMAPATSSAAQLAEMKDGKCGTGKCGSNMQSQKPMKDGKCGKMEGSKGMKDGKCGQGKCGGNMKMQKPQKSEMKMKDGKCGQGKCGGMK